MSDIYIIDGVRTPIGAYLGQYKKTESVELGAHCLQDLFQRNNKSFPRNVPWAKS